MQSCIFNRCGKDIDYLVQRFSGNPDAGTEINAAVRVLYLADVLDYVLYSTANEQR